MNGFLASVALSLMVLGNGDASNSAVPAPARAGLDGVHVSPSSSAPAPRFSAPWLREAPAATPLADAIATRHGRRLWLVPRACESRGQIDLVVHFHGAPETVEKAARSSRLDAAVVVVNLGAFSGPYETAFEQRGSFARFVASLDSELAARCPGATRRRLALSSWSGGYGATFRILAESSSLASIDAVLLSDGLHSAIANPYTRELKPAHLAPFTAYATLAARGEKLMAISHSSVLPPSYSSTTETARFLLQSQGGAVESVALAGPRPKMRLTSHGEVQGLRVLGFAGNDTHAHCDQLYAIGDTLWTTLAERWSK